MENQLNTFEPYRKWKYKKITVKPNTALQNQPYYVSELKKLQARNEKETGIEFVINDDNTYQDFIALIDAMKLAKQDTYGVDVEKTNHFFAVHEYQDPHRCGNYGGCGLVGGEFTPEKPVLNIFRPESFIQHFPQQAYYVLFGFLFFLNISMLSIQENIQLKRKSV